MIDKLQNYRKLIRYMIRLEYMIRKFSSHRLKKFALVLHTYERGNLNSANYDQR